MGLTPLPPPWPKGHKPTDQELWEYGAYLERSMASTFLGKRRLAKHGRMFTNKDGGTKPIDPEWAARD